MGRSQKTSPDAIKGAERSAEALAYRRQGYSYAQIAKAMGFSEQRAAFLVKRGIAAIIEDDAKAVLALEVERMDEMMAGAYEAAVGGDVQAINAVLKIMERRARYFGLDQVQPQAISVTGGDYANSAFAKLASLLGTTLTPAKTSVDIEPES